MDLPASVVSGRTKPGAAISEAQAIARAQEEADRMVARASEQAKAYRQAADSAVAEEAAARERRDQTRTALKAVTEQIESVLQEQLTITDPIPQNPARDHAGSSWLERLNNTKRDLDTQFRDLDPALQRQQKMLEELNVVLRARKTQQADDARGSSRCDHA